MPLVQDRSLELLPSSPARNHCATDDPSPIFPPSPPPTHTHTHTLKNNGNCIGLLIDYWTSESDNKPLSIRKNSLCTKGLSRILSGENKYLHLRISWIAGVTLTSDVTVTLLEWRIHSGGGGRGRAFSVQTSHSLQVLKHTRCRMCKCVISVS